MPSLFVISNNRSLGHSILNLLANWSPSLMYGTENSFKKIPPFKQSTSNIFCSLIEPGFCRDVYGSLIITPHQHWSLDFKSYNHQFLQPEVFTGCRCHGPIIIFRVGARNDILLLTFPLSPYYHYQTTNNLMWIIDYKQIQPNMLWSITTTTFRLSFQVHQDLSYYIAMRFPQGYGWTGWQCSLNDIN